MLPIHVAVWGVWSESRDYVSLSTVRRALYAGEGLDWRRIADESGRMDADGPVPAVSGRGQNMNAFPMFQRCAVQQWRGLLEKERAYIEQAWERGRPPAHATMSGYNIFPVWTVERASENIRENIHILSVKIDGPFKA